MASLTGEEFKDVAIGDIGTQLFWFNTQHSGEGTSEKPYTGSFEYAVPVTAGAEFGGDTESFEAPETDLDYVPKIQGRTTLNDITYTINYTKEKYARVEQISNSTEAQAYMEVFSDGSAMIFKGTAGRPTITGGDVRQITFTIVPSYMQWIKDIYTLTEADKGNIDPEHYSGSVIKIDNTTLPKNRPDYVVKKPTPTPTGK